MPRRLRVALAAAPLLLSAIRAPAAPLTPGDAARLGADAAADLVPARLRADAARLELTVAGVATEPSTFEAAAGPRHAPDGTSVDAEIAWERPFDGGARRSSRVLAAHAAVAAADAQLARVRADGAANALRAHGEVVHALALHRLAAERLALAQELHRVARDRMDAGEVARFDVNAAGVELASAESEADRTQAEAEAAAIRLGAALGGVTVTVDSVEARLPGEEEAEALLAIPEDAAHRPDVLAARQEQALAEAQADLVAATARPPMALRLSASREEDAEAVLAGVVIALPSAARTRAAVEGAALVRESAGASATRTLVAAESEVRAARAALLGARRASARLQGEASRLAAENAALAHEGYAAGKFDLPSVLVFRREALLLRRESLDAQLALSQAVVDLWAALGAPEGVFP